METQIVESEAHVVTKEDVLSASKKYKVEIIHKSSQLVYFKIIRVEDCKLIYECTDTFFVISSKFFTLNGQEWLYVNRHYGLQLFINLETEEIYENCDQFDNTETYNDELYFCWSKFDITPDGQTLVVCGNYVEDFADGGVWVSPKDVRFFDFSDPRQGWPEILVKDEIYNDLCHRYDRDYEIMKDKILINESANGHSYNLVKCRREGQCLINIGTEKSSR
jgi:hypothetical protein